MNNETQGGGSCRLPAFLERKNKMKKILAIFLVVMVLLSLTACRTAEVNELLEQIGDLNEALS